LVFPSPPIAICRPTPPEPAFAANITVTTNQSKETNSVVDIGFHYIVLSAGLPWDTDGDTLADYSEDRNGNGSPTPDTGQTDWDNVYDSPNGLSGTPGLEVLTPLR
jgi:hypothetical protein